jgi:DNA-binding response OmpR family regulator
MAKDQKPDVVLLDLRIPGTSGKLLYGKMLEHEPQLGSRVIVLSGESQSSEDAAWFAAQSPLRVCR